MAQSRFEKIGTIYSRVTGLYKSGAIKSEQVPLWLPLYEAFPPKYEPRWDRKPEEKNLVNILYQEDAVRAKFYKKFGDWEVVNFFENKKPTSQLFVDKFMQISENEALDESEVWDRTISELEHEGVDLHGSSKQSESLSDQPKTSKALFTDLFNDEAK